MSSPDRILPCGRFASWLVDIAARDEPDAADVEHLRSCPYCRGELAVLRRRWVAVRAAAARPVRVPSGMVGRTLSAVRAVRGGGGVVSRHVETAQQGGVVRVGEPALVLLTRRTARDVVDGLAGIRFRGLSGGTDGFEVRVAVRYGLVLTEAAALVRRDIGRALERVLGVAAPPLDVLVVDVLGPGRSR